MSNVFSIPGGDHAATPERITLLAFRRRMTMASLARASGIQRTYLSQKMHGKTRWYLKDVEAIAAALDTTIAFLTGETDDPERMTGGVFVPSEEYRAFCDWREMYARNEERPAEAGLPALSRVALSQPVLGGSEPPSGLDSECARRDSNPQPSDP